MHRILIVLCAIAGLSQASNEHCKAIFFENALSRNLNETIGHAIHSMTVEGLRLFNPKATAKNLIPTVRLSLSRHGKTKPVTFVSDNAPDVSHGKDFKTRTMNVIDSILSTIGHADDGLGPNWSPIERVAHVFHMWDLWEMIHDVYMVEVKPRPPSKEVCACLIDVHSNGIYTAVQWVAKHYETGTPITLLNKPIPKLQDANSWAVWKERLLHYYTAPALRDAALFMHCATKDF